MVKVQYNGRLGNQLTQYAFGRLLAKKIGQTFYADPIPEFPELPTCIGNPTRDDSDRIIVNGYFENSDHLADSFLEILKWFNPPNPRREICSIHIRGGDAAAEGFRCPPIDYYRSAIQKQKLNSIILTDDPLDPVVKQISSEFGFEVNCTIPVLDLETIRSSESIIIGNSTFAWWGAFLSGHNNVTQPAPSSGWRSKLNRNSCLLMHRWNQIPYEPAPRN